MNRSVKVTVSLPIDMLDRIEQDRAERGESRSEFVRASLEQAFRGRRDQSDRERYIRGYEQCPESEDEIRIADQFSRSALVAEPWE